MSQSIAPSILSVVIAIMINWFLSHYTSGIGMIFYHLILGLVVAIGIGYMFDKTINKKRTFDDLLKDDKKKK